MTKILFLTGALLASLLSRGQSIDEEIDGLEKNYLKGPANYDNYDNIQVLLTTKYGQLSPEQRRRLRSLLEKSTFSKITTYPPGEQGIRIILRGTVRDQNGKPVKSAKITVFQTDAQGNYAPQDAVSNRMSESDARLFGVLRTDVNGEYQLKAIRPASYPRKYEGRLIPQHIHFNIEAKGYAESRLQVVFEDDPAMQDPHWREWAENAHFPVVKLTTVNGVKSGVCNIVLH